LEINIAVTYIGIYMCCAYSSLVPIHHRSTQIARSSLKDSDFLAPSKNETVLSYYFEFNENFNYLY
jgi:hypothetical protein